jgi:acyl CoA:acetate/3-ketoacid CoA transferase alpha subunit
MTLTEAKIKAATPKPAKYAMNDHRVRELSLMTQITGNQTWVLRTTINGKQVKRTIGRYPVMLLKQARETALELLRKPQSIIGQTPKDQIGRAHV